MNVITSFTSLFTIVVRLIAIQVLHSYLQAQLGYNVERNLFRCVQVYKYGICYDIYCIHMRELAHVPNCVQFKELSISEIYGLRFVST